MAPWHPVPEGYGAPCDEGEFVSQGTGSGPVIYKYQNTDDLFEDNDDAGNYNRHARDLSTGHLYDC